MIKFNKWIGDIHRLFIPRGSKSINKRLDYAERTVNFPSEYYNNFINSLTQEDFITYHS